MKQFLRLPLNFGKVLEGENFNICDVKLSISMNLHLLITTVRGEHKSDENYGAKYLDYDYDIHLPNDKRRDIIIESLQEQISIYEPRLTNVSIQVNVKQEVTKSDTGGFMQRRRVEIIIAGSIARSEEPYQFQTAFFIGPMDFD